MLVPALFVPRAQAQDFGLKYAQRVGLPQEPLPEKIILVINWALLLVAVVALGYLVYGGFLYLTSGGDENRIETAKRILIYAVIGIAVIGIAAATVNFVIGALLGGGQ